MELFDDPENLSSVPDDDFSAGLWEPEDFRKARTGIQAVNAEQYDIYLQWKDKYQIVSLRGLLDWFSDAEDDELCEGRYMDERRYLYRYLRELPADRHSVDEIISAMEVRESCGLYDALLEDRFLPFLTQEEIERFRDRFYLIWKCEHRIVSLKDLWAYYSEELLLGPFSLYLGMGSPKTFEFLKRFLSEMPLTRRAAEEIMEYAADFDTEELYEALSTRYRGFLTEKEAEFYIRE